MTIATAQPQQPISATLNKLLRSLLAAQLGTFVDGKLAIWVEAPQAPPVGTGVHVYIARHYAQITNSTYTWRVDLVLHGGQGATPQSKAVYEANLQKFDQAIELIRQKFPMRREVIPPYREDLPPQATFQLVVTQYINDQRLLIAN